MASGEQGWAGAGREGEILTEGNKGNEGLTTDFSDGTDEGVGGSKARRVASGGWAGKPTEMPRREGAGRAEEGLGVVDLSSASTEASARRQLYRC